MNIIKHNHKVWNKADQTDLEIWAKPVSAEVVQRAREGVSDLLLTNSKSVPSEWYMPIKGKKVLCLASGGGQQAPLLSAMGACVTSFDISESQLAKDQMVKEREDLNLDIIQGDMSDLSIFDDNTFDMIFHPISNCFIPDPTPVWKECYRVLKQGGVLLAGFINPVLYLFDMDALDQGKLIIKNTIPYSDIEQLSKEALKKRIDNEDTLEFGHTLETQIGGQTKLGFGIVGFYEDICYADVLDRHILSSIATKAIKL